MAKATVRMGGTMQTTITARDHIWLADETASDGGTDSGPSATELLLGALGACAAITARMYAERKGWPLEGVEIDLDLRRVKRDPAVHAPTATDTVNEFRERLTFLGPLTEEQKLRLMEIAMRCPVHRILTQTNVVMEELAVPPVTQPPA